MSKVFLLRVSNENEFRYWDGNLTVRQRRDACEFRTYAAACKELPKVAAQYPSELQWSIVEK